jgi:hypothetical protein
LSTDRPTIGLYGKVGAVKGSFDLVSALCRLKTRGTRFNLLAMVGGSDRDAFMQSLDSSGLLENTWTLPFLPHWRVPGFLRACTAVCFLERRFPIAIHTPGIPREVLACGTCAVVSKEIADKQRFRSLLRDGENAFVVKDPSDIEDLAHVLQTVVSDPSRAVDVGRSGSSLVKVIGTGELADVYGDIFIDAISSISRVGGRAESARPRQWGSGDKTGAAIRLLTRYMPATLKLFAIDLPSRLAQLSSAINLDELEVADFVHHCAAEVVASLEPSAVESGRSALLDFARFERELLWLALDCESAAGECPFPPPRLDLLLSRPHRAFPQMVPVRSRWLRMAEFRNDIEEALEVARRGESVPEAVGKKAWFLFQKRGDLMGRTFRINDRTHELLAQCDGIKTVEQIGASLCNNGSSDWKPLFEQIALLRTELVIALE